MTNGENSFRGLQSKRAGEQFERLIEAALARYAEAGVAEIEKTPEPVKQLRAPNRQGQFLACYIKAAQPDFKGTLAGGRSVVFEAKHTDADRMTFDRVTLEQRQRLRAHSNLGAEAFVMVSFGLRDFYRIPWPVWRDMREIFGRKYITPADLEDCRVPYVAGGLMLLEGIKIN